MSSHFIIQQTSKRPIAKLHRPNIDHDGDHYAVFIKMQ